MWFVNNVKYGLCHSTEEACFFGSVGKAVVFHTRDLGLIPSRGTRQELRIFLCSSA